MHVINLTNLNSITNISVCNNDIALLWNGCDCVKVEYVYI